MEPMISPAALAASTTLVLGAHIEPKANREMQAVLDQLTALGGKPVEQLPPQEARQQPTPADAVKALLNGVTHEFFGMGAVLEESRGATKLAAMNLMKAFDRAGERLPVRAKEDK